MKISVKLLLPVIAGFLATPALADSIYALTSDNELLVLDAAVPQKVVSIVNITGLSAGEDVLGIDVRPANGLLYALTASTNFTLPRIFTINPATGVATLVGGLIPDVNDVTSPFTGLAGTSFAIDFNPQADRLRIVSNTEQNLRVDVSTGATFTDTNLAYAAGDANDGANPNVAAIAYTNNSAGVGSTSLIGIDDTTFRVVTISPPANGTLTSGAAFGAVNATHVGFDIAPSGVAYVAGRHTVPNFPEEWVLVTLDIATGEGGSLGPIGDSTIPIIDIAVAPSIEFSVDRYSAFETSGNAVVTVRRTAFINNPATVNYATIAGSAQAGSDFFSASGTLSFGASQNTLIFQVPIIDDDFPETDEFLHLVLSGVAGPGVLGSPSVATLRINASDTLDKTGPQITFIGLTGPSRGIDGAVIHFNEDLDPVSAANLANYSLTAIPKRGKPQKLSFDSAIYDPVSRTVTLGLDEFEQTDFKRMILKVNGKTGGVEDLAGNLLNGDRNKKPGGNAVQAFKVFSNETLTFKDRDGDKVSITVADGGRLDGVLPLKGPLTQDTQFWIVDPISLVSSISGTVTKSRTGDGIVVIAEIIGLDKKEFAPLVSNPSFRIGRLTFSPNATGLR